MISGTAERITRLSCILAVGLLMLPLGLAPDAWGADDEGFKPIFDGKTLEGWDGNPQFWSVEDGAITGQTSPDNPTKGNTFIIWRGGQPGDFELKLEYRLRNHNSGIQFRSWEEPDKWGKWVIGGYQADIAEPKRFDGILYGERFRGILCMRGDKTVIGTDHKPKVVGKLGDSDELFDAIGRDEWNEYHIVAKGNHLAHYVNGNQMVDVTDDDVEQRRDDGLIALQLHAGPPMKVQFRNIRLKLLDEKEGNGSAEKPGKKIVFLAGRKSHGYGGHEHHAGCLLLAKWLEKAMPDVETVVCKEGWPNDPSVLVDADAIVVYCDGGGGHLLNPHLEETDALMDKGVGLALLHYGVETPKGKPGDCFLKWIGGYFETHWSVNPHWTAEFTGFPTHPTTRGVHPFTINDEWYYHMRFQEDMKGVTPVLTAIPPDSTRERPDGAHSNNPTVRARKGMPEHLAWAYERPGGGRGFGFTGGHWHWEWGHPGFRTVVLNAIAWTAGLEVPDGGVPSEDPTLEELEADQDYPQPGNFDRQRIQAMLDGWQK